MGCGTTRPRSPRPVFSSEARAAPQWVSFLSGLHLHRSEVESLRMKAQMAPEHVKRPTGLDGALYLRRTPHDTTHMRAHMHHTHAAHARNAQQRAAARRPIQHTRTHAAHALAATLPIGSIGSQPLCRATSYVPRRAACRLWATLAASSEASARSEAQRDAARRSEAQRGAARRTSPMSACMPGQKHCKELKSGHVTCTHRRTRER